MALDHSVAIPPLQHMRLRKATLLAIALAIAAWTVTSIYVLQSKSSFLDDAFTYLHIARNVVDEGSAQFFPIVENRGLLASSPLRLLLYLPSEAVASAVYDGARSLPAARLSFVLSGLFTGALFLPFYRSRWTRWIFGFAFTGFLARTAGTALQMEGLLVAWSFFTLTLLLLEDEADRSYFLRMGGILAILVCSRPELGLPAAAVAVVDAATRRRLSLLRWALVIPVAGALLWSLLCAVWEVYPIPTTYLSKILTGEANWTVTFAERLHRMIGGKFLRLSDAGLTVAGLILLSALIARSKRLLLLIPIFASAIALLWSASGYFTWYQENLFCGFMAVGIASLISLDRRAPWRHWIAAAILVLPTLRFAKFLDRDIPMPWNFAQPDSRAIAYSEVGRRANEAGLFEIPGAGVCYVMTIEIGILAYFGGPDCWFVDMANLTTPGGFRRDVAPWADWLYPRSLLRTPEEEYHRVSLELPESRRHRYPIYFVEGARGSEYAKRKCTYYFSDVGLCMRQMATGDEIGAVLSKPLR